MAGRGCLLRVSHDITANKGAEQALRDSEKKFATAFQASPMALTIVEMASGRFIETNPAFERISGYTRDEAIGRTSLELGLWSPTDRAAHVARLERDGFVRGMVLTFRARGGREVLMNSNAEVIMLGGLRCILTVLEDVSEQRRAELRQATLEAQLRQNQKLEALGTLAGGIAHDFNNILTAIVVNQELALMDSHDPGAVRERLSEIGRASNRGKELGRQILTFSRQQPPERSRQQLQITSLEALRLVRASLAATIEILQDLSPEAPDVLADAGQVHQIVMNLCTNAAHAMRDRPGCLAVRLGIRRLDQAACDNRPPLRPGLHAVLTVADTGHGMAARGDGAYLRTILYDEGARRRHRPGSADGPRHHARSRRRHLRGEPARALERPSSCFSRQPTRPGARRCAGVSDETHPCAGTGESVLGDRRRELGDLARRSAPCSASSVTASKPSAIRRRRLARFCGGTGTPFGLARLTDRTMPRLTGPELIASGPAPAPAGPARRGCMSGLNEADDDSSAQASGYSIVPKPLEHRPAFASGASSARSAPTAAA